VSWDRQSAKALGKLQDERVREQVRHVVAPFSPYWKRRFAELGQTPSSVDGVAGLAQVPAVGERDVSPSGEPAGMAALVLQASESGFALHAEGPKLRRALRLRLTDKQSYRALVEGDTRPTAYVWTGLGFRYPLASTRGDLDVVARAGARLWQVLGLSAADALVAAIPVSQTVELVGLQYAALATGTPALFPGEVSGDVVAAARLAPPTVLAVPVDRATEVVDELSSAGALDRLQTLLLVGVPTDAERAAAQETVGQHVTVRAVHAPVGARVLWGECREAGAEGGLHSYPDLEVVQLVDAETGDNATEAGEVVLTQLGLRGSALLRWRTGDVTDAPVDRSQCRGCGRTVPRVHGVRRGALVLHSDHGSALDLRALAGALAGRSDLTDWRVVIGPRGRDGRSQVVVHLSTEADAGPVAVGVAGDVRAVAGLLPTQLVAAPDGLGALTGDALTRRILRRRPGG
jgi:phenylacetate-coenzyme A ligase PaaK-like adenylate-forming protein